MRNASVTITGVPIDPATSLKREPSRDPSQREPGFDAKFDSDTLFFDAVRDPAHGAVRIVAPPLFNLHSPLAQSRFTDGECVGELDFTVVNYDRQTQILLRDHRTDSLALTGPIGDYRIPVVNAEQDLFAGRRTVLTLSKNNDLVWIKDWLGYYRSVHGADAVLFYDNGSSDYSADELMSVLSSVEGIDVAVVVRWPFKHGPTGGVSKKFWDSNFSQLGMLEHARWRFLARAKSVINCDIDELIVSKSQRSIFAAVEESRSGVISFHGDWVVGIKGITREATADEPVTYSDFRYILKSLVRLRLALNPIQLTHCAPKWAVVPGRMPANARWHNHYIEHWLASRLSSKDFRFRHFREISRSWKYDRTHREALDPRRHAADAMMVDAFGKAGWLDEAGTADVSTRRSMPQLSSFSS